MSTIPSGNTNSLMVTSDQRQVLEAIFDTFIPELSPEDTRRLVETYGEDDNHRNQLESFAKRKGSEVVDEFIKMINDPEIVPKSDAQQILTAMTILSSALGTFLLTGYFRPIPQLSLKEREQAFYSLLSSSFETKRSIANGLRQVVMLLFFSTVPPQSSHAGIDPMRINPNWAAIRYPGPDPEASGEKYEKVRAKLFRLNPIDLLSYCNFQTAKEATRMISTPEVRFDAIVIGSGPGGGAVALQLAQAGHRVLIIEAGKYYHPEDLTLLELESFQRMTMQRSALATSDKSFSVMSGETFGGGSAINWSCSLDTPSTVRKEWCEKYGLPFFTSKGYSQCLEHVKQVMNVQEEGIQHNKCNQKLLEGAKQLGYPARATPQNAPIDHNCGWCTMGCKYGLKRGTNTTFIPLAMEYGAQVAVECRVNKILYRNKSSDEISSLQKTLKRYSYPSTLTLPEFNNDRYDIHTTEKHVSTHFFDKRIPSPYRPSAYGVEAVFTTKSGRQQAIELRAPLIVVSGGSLQSPLLLKRSGFTNYNIGKNLHIHPACGIAAVYPEKIDCFVGSPLTTVCDVTKNQTPDGYGAIVEIASSHPGLAAAALPWYSGYELKRHMTQFTSMVPFISIVRDTATGTVSEGPDGRPIIDYAMNDLDKQHLTNGIIAAANIHIAAGATEIILPHFGIPPFIPDPLLGVVDQRFEDLCSLIKWHGIHPHGLMMFSAHQMSSNRMSSTKALGAVRGNGETFEVDNVFVADGSILPTASGVNPMVTILAISQFVALNASERLRLLKMISTGDGDTATTTSPTTTAVSMSTPISAQASAPTTSVTASSVSQSVDAKL